MQKNYKDNCAIVCTERWSEKEKITGKGMKKFGLLTWQANKPNLIRFLLIHIKPHLSFQSCGLKCCFF